MCKKNLIILLVLSIVQLKHVVSYAEVVDRVVASVEGLPVTESDIEKELKRISPTTPVEHPISSENLKTGLTGILLEREASKLGISVTEEEVEEQINNVINKNNLSREQFENSLKETGMSLSQYREKLASELNRNRVIGTALKQKIQVTDEELKSYMGESKIEEESDIDKFGLFKLESLVKEIDTKQEAQKLSDYLKSGGLCETYKSSIFLNCTNLGVFKIEDLKEDYAKLVNSKANFEFSDIVIENGRDFFLFKTEANISTKGSSIGQEIRDKLFQDKFKKEAEKYLTKDIFEKYLVETHF